MSPTATPQAVWSAPPVAVFADQSLVWGLICRDALETLNLPARFLTARDIAAGALERFRVLLVPGGWAGHKLRALGEAGREAVERFVAAGGSYLGFCGGAGLALSGPGTLNLVPVRRLPVERRLPNISGAVWIAPPEDGGPADPPAWDDLPPAVPTHLWWPSQFAASDGSQITVLARYLAIGRDFHSADLALADLIDLPGPIPWDEWEARYGMALDPRRLIGQPAILEATHGRGRLVLSYPHLETPGDLWGQRLFGNLLAYLEQRAAPHRPLRASAALPDSKRPPAPCAGSLYHLERAALAVDELIEFGRRRLFWDWRTPWLLNWRRGLRGLEYSTLAVTLGSLRAGWPQRVDSGCAASPWLAPARELEAEVRIFCRQARRLLLEEQVAIQVGALSKIGSVNPTVDRLREELFGTQMNHGGRCRRLFDRIDRFLTALWQLPPWDSKRTDSDHGESAYGSRPMDRAPERPALGIGVKADRTG